MNTFQFNNLLKRQYILNNLPVVFILLIGLFLRIYKLESYPSQIHVDELSNIYDGYSLAESGTDRWSVKHPAIIRGYGDNDYRSPLYVWLCAITIKLFGYSVFSGRLPSVFFGMLSLIILYATGRKIGGTMFGYMSLVLATLSPWHIIFSRLALESAILPSFFMILTIYLFILVRESSFKPLHVACLGFCIGFATNNYQSMKLIFFVVFVCVLLYTAVYPFKNLKAAGILILSAALSASPQLYVAITSPEHFFSRAANTMMPFHFSLQYLSKFFENFFTNLSPQFLFLGFGTYNNLTVARLLSIEMSFFYLGLLVFYWNFKSSKNFNPLYIYVSIIVSIIPSALTFDNPHALRTSCNVILYPIITVSGFLFIYKCINARIAKAGLVVFLLVCIVINFTVTANKYLKNRELIDAGQQNLLVELGKKVNRYQSSFDNIYIEDIGNQPYMYITYYCKIHPQSFKQMYKINIGTGWDHFQQLGKFYFLNKDSVVKNLEINPHKNLAVLTSKILTHSLIDSVSIYGENLYFYKN